MITEIGKRPRGSALTAPDTQGWINTCGETNWWVLERAWSIDHVLINEIKYSEGRNL
jgi:hypothetical protein